MSIDLIAERLEQMAKVIDDYCESVDRCGHCRIQHLCDYVGTDFEQHPKICEDAYEVVTNLSTANSVVNHPSHYTQGNIECIDAMVSAFGKERTAEYCVQNAFKYVWRSEHKNGKEDIKKAIWYLNKSIELGE